MAHGRKLLIIIIFLTFFPLFSASSQEDTTNQKSPAFMPRKATPLQIMEKSDDDIEGLETTGSQDRGYTPTQDSAFIRARELQMPIGIRLWYDLLLSNDLWQVNRRVAAGTPWQIAMKNMEMIPPEAFLPTEYDIVSRQINLENAQYVPYLNTTQKYGLKIPLGAIASFLGLTEDVSPNIKYTIDFKAEIEIVVYSIQATVIATIFKGVQQPGTYEFVWNGRNDEGKVMPSGDYIAEVRIGNDRYLRKRIVIP